MKKPNFLIIGAARAGTTSLYRYLQQHPQIYMPSWKEPNFFGHDEDNSIEDYYALFQGNYHEKVIGEASTLYLYNPKAPLSIKTYLPNIKLIAILRNPVDRAYSGFLHNVGKIPDPLNHFIQSIKDRKNQKEDITGNSLKMGFYYVQLKRYFDLFEKHQIKIYLYEEFASNPLLILQDIFRFLDIDENFVPDFSSKQHITYCYKNSFFYTLSQLSLLKASFKKMMPKTLFTWLKHKHLERPQKLPLEIRKQLLKEYHPDIIKLQDLLQRDLSIWLNSTSAHYEINNY